MPFKKEQFNGGTNLEDFLASLADNEVRIAVNAIITKKGSLKKREGSSEYGTDANTDPVYGLKNYTDDNNNAYKFKAINTKIVEYNNGDWATEVKTGLTAGLYVEMSDIKCPAVASVTTGTASAGDDYSLTDAGIGWTQNQYRDYVIKITAGTGVGQIKTILENTTEIAYVDGKWDVKPDATSVYSIHAKVKAVVCNNGTDTGFKIIGTTPTNISNLPKFTDQIVHNGRLWGILGTKVYWSGLGNGEQWDGWAYIDTSEDLIGIGRTKDYVVVYTKTKTGVVIGNSVDTFAFKFRENTHGCIAKNSIASHGGYSLALSQDGVYAFDGTGDYYLSRKIKPAITAIKDSLRGDSAGFVFQDKYYLMVAANSTSTAKDTIWVLDLIWTDIPNAVLTSAWTSFEGLNPNVMGVFKDSNGLLDLYIGSSVDSKVLLLYDGTYSDSGLAIKWDIEDKEYDNGQVGNMKRFAWFFAEAATQLVDSTLQFYQNLDNYGFNLISNIDCKQVGGIWDVGLFDVAIWGGQERVIKRIRTGGRGRTIQYKFYNNSADEPAEVFKYEHEFQLYKYH